MEALVAEYKAKQAEMVQASLERMLLSVGPKAESISSHTMFQLHPRDVLEQIHTLDHQGCVCSLRLRELGAEIQRLKSAEAEKQQKEALIDQQARWRILAINADR
jgi:hypothetical protein